MYVPESDTEAELRSPLFDPTNGAIFLAGGAPPEGTVP